MGSNSLNFLPRLLAAAPATDTVVLALFSTVALFGGIFCLVFMLFEMGEVRRLRERNRRTHDEWQQAYTSMFRMMLDRLHEAQQPPSVNPTAPPDSDDEYFARLSRPRKFLSPH